MAATHAGITTEEFEKIVNGLDRHRAPSEDSKRPYTEMVYQPMLELLAYLRANGFKTFIVSGGGVEFMRPWAERVYGIPPEQVIGSRAKVKYELRDGKPVLLRLAEIDLIDDKAGQAGRHPAGDRPAPDPGVRQLRRRLRDARVDDVRAGTALRRCSSTTPTPSASRPTTATSHIGQLARGLDEAPKRGWLVVDMKNDWKVIYPFEK